MRHVLSFVLFLLLLPAAAGAQASFYSHDNYTQYELLDPATHQFAITYYVTERRAGAIYLLNQTRSGSEGTDISVFDPQTGKPLKFDYMTGEQLTASGMTGRFDPAEHYIRAHLARPVPEGGEGRVRILKTYKDEKSYYAEGEEIFFKRSLGIARNAVVLPKGFRLVSSNVAAQVFTLPDGRLKISFEHAHGYAADVTIRGRKGAALPPGSIRSERSFDFGKVLYEFGDDGSVSMTREIVTSTPGPTAYLHNPIGGQERGVVDVDSGRRLEVTAGREGPNAQLIEPIAGPNQSARLRLMSTARNGYSVSGGAFTWETQIADPRATILLPASYDVVAVSVPATVATQPDGRVAIQIYNGTDVPLRVTVRAAKR